MENFRQKIFDLEKEIKIAKERCQIAKAEKKAEFKLKLESLESEYSISMRKTDMECERRIAECERRIAELRDERHNENRELNNKIFEILSQSTNREDAISLMKEFCENLKN